MDVFRNSGLSGVLKKCFIRQKRRLKFLNSFDFYPVLLEKDKLNPEKCVIRCYQQENLPINHISSGAQSRESGTMNRITMFFNGIINNFHIFHDIQKDRTMQKQ